MPAGGGNGPHVAGPDRRMVLDLMRGAARLLRSVPRRLRGRQSVFTRIYATNEWGSPESVSGYGSTLQETRVARRVLPSLLTRYGVEVLLDIPCGDCHWMREIDFCGRTYVGADIVAELIDRNQSTYGGPNRSFMHRDVVRDPLPPTDLVLCRDCMILQAPPFQLPPPLELISEEWDWADGYHADKCLALWDTAVLPR